jgi:hypothetical protein
MKSKRMTTIMEWLFENNIEKEVINRTHEYPQIKINLSETMQVFISVRNNYIEFFLLILTERMSFETKSIKEGWYLYENKLLGYDYKKLIFEPENAINEIKKLMGYFK